MKFLIVLLLVFVPLVASAKKKVATLHPVLTDIAKSVGGDKLVVVGLVDDGRSVHEFQPTASSLKKANGAVLYLAAGKGLEPYLGKLRGIVGANAKVVEVGRKITSITVSKSNSLFVCCPGHSHGTLDPHWWNSVKNVRRATGIILAELIRIDPANKAHYKANAKKYRRKLDLLDAWVKKQISTIPKNRRYLATAHAAYAYFCKDYGFKSIPVQGLSREHANDAKYLELAISVMKKNKVKVIFPEVGNNPKDLAVVAKASGARVGGKLIPDGITDVEKMFKQNVNTIVKGLKP